MLRGPFSSRPRKMSRGRLREQSQKFCSSSFRLKLRACVLGQHEKKAGKGRLDKFYWLAKEQGYRSRAAFKLVQLNKKYNFLENAHCCIDLCAAPGGWLQVASKHMPPNSLILGVDLVPIKPIPRCITFAEDINSYRCRDQLREHMKDWKADVVLHDGAPNVGTAWVQDAYAQNELTLQSLGLAVSDTHRSRPTTH